MACAYLPLTIDVPGGAVPVRRAALRGGARRAVIAAEWHEYRAWTSVHGDRNPVEMSRPVCLGRDINLDG